MKIKKRTKKILKEWVCLSKRHVKHVLVNAFIHFFTEPFCMPVTPKLLAGIIWYNFMNCVSDKYFSACKCVGIIPEQSNGGETQW